MPDSSSHCNHPIHGLLKTVARLRAPGGCPWDREQTHRSLRPYLIEEAYETLELLDQVESPQDIARGTPLQKKLTEEFGDVLMQVVLHSEIANETGSFDFADVVSELDQKLVRRHPHVFGDADAKDADAALGNWEKQKAKEREKQTPGSASVLDGLPTGMPAMQRAARTIHKVSKVGFQWKDLEGPMDKVEEEWGEFKSALKDHQEASPKGEPSPEMIEEFGDLLFSLANIAYHLKINPEDALRSNLRRFEKRFRFVEQKITQSGRTLDQSNLEEMDEYWNQAKKLES